MHQQPGISNRQTERADSGVGLCHHSPMHRLSWILPLFLVGFALRPAPMPDSAPTDCGDPTAVIPAFALTDVNPNSPSYNLVRSRDEFLGKVVVIYWATAT